MQILYVQVLYALCFTRSRYQVSVYRTNGPLVYWIFFELAGQISDEFEIRTAVVAAIERLNKSTYTYNGRNVVSTLVHSLLIGFSSFVQERRTRGPMVM